MFLDTQNLSNNAEVLLTTAFSPIQSLTQHNTTQHNTTQHNTTQHNIYRRNFFQQNKFIWNKKTSPTSSWNAIFQGALGAGLFLYSPRCEQWEL